MSGKRFVSDTAAEVISWDEMGLDAAAAQPIPGIMDVSDTPSSEDMTQDSVSIDEACEVPMDQDGAKATDECDSGCTSKTVSTDITLN
jgi:hypothetical protein